MSHRLVIDVPDFSSFCSTPPPPPTTSHSPMGTWQAPSATPHRGLLFGPFTKYNALTGGGETAGKAVLRAGLSRALQGAVVHPSVGAEDPDTAHAQHAGVGHERAIQGVCADLCGAGSGTKGQGAARLKGVQSSASDEAQAGLCDLHGCFLDAVKSVLSGTGQDTGRVQNSRIYSGVCGHSSRLSSHACARLSLTATLVALSASAPAAAASVLRSLVGAGAARARSFAAVVAAACDDAGAVHARSQWVW